MKILDKIIEMVTTYGRFFGPQTTQEQLNSLVIVLSLKTYSDLVKEIASSPYGYDNYMKLDQEKILQIMNFKIKVVIDSNFSEKTEIDLLCRFFTFP